MFKVNLIDNFDYERDSLLLVQVLLGKKDADETIDYLKEKIIEMTKTKSEV